jgi:hypothetical protein
VVFAISPPGYQPIGSSFQAILSEAAGIVVHGDPSWHLFERHDDLKDEEQEASLEATLLVRSEALNSQHRDGRQQSTRYVSEAHAMTVRRLGQTEHPCPSIILFVSRN